MFTPTGARIDWPGHVNSHDVWLWEWTEDETKVLLRDSGEYQFTITAANTAPTTGLIEVESAVEPPRVIVEPPDDAPTGEASCRATCKIFEVDS